MAQKFKAMGAYACSKASRARDKSGWAVLNNAKRRPGYGRTTGMRRVIARAEPAAIGCFCVFAEGGCSLSDCFTDRVQVRCDCLRMWTNFGQNGFKIEPAQGTGSDRKDAKAVVPDCSARAVLARDAFLL
ncbi:hypothetical protein EBO33_02945 [[Curtobacterium] plantarum]|nr:hypothetical protein EBO33_02945 [[Curtobacterium] plantarum]